MFRAVLRFPQEKSAVLLANVCNPLEFQTEKISEKIACGFLGFGADSLRREKGKLPRQHSPGSDPVKGQ